MVRDQLTVKGIAERICRFNTAAEREKLTERLRYWSRDGWIEPVGPLSTGSGRWRTYPEEAVFVAAVLDELWALSQPKWLLHAIGKNLTGHLYKTATFMQLYGEVPVMKRDGECIRRAIRGEPAFLTVMWTPEDSEIELVYKAHPEPPKASAVVLNLTEIFARARP